MFENEERMRKGREEYAHISFVWFAKKKRNENKKMIYILLLYPTK